MKTLYTNHQIIRSLRIKHPNASWATLVHKYREETGLPILPRFKEIPTKGETHEPSPRRTSVRPG